MESPRIRELHASDWPAILALGAAEVWFQEYASDAEFIAVRTGYVAIACLSANRRLRNHNRGAPIENASKDNGSSAPSVAISISVTETAASSERSNAFEIREPNDWLEASSGWVVDSATSSIAAMRERSCR